MKTMTDEEIIYAALRLYSAYMFDCGNAAAQKSFRLPSGCQLTAEEVSETLRVARRASEMILEKA